MMPLDPVVGGTILRIPAIQSPNFSMAGQTGWAIEQNGNAYFFNITAQGTITGSVFEGNDFIINSSGAFFYTGTPANGNLFLSIASADGTDDFSNAYQGPGVAIYAGGQTIFLGLIGTTPQLEFSTGASFESVPSGIAAAAEGSGATEYLSIGMNSAKTTGESQELVGFGLNSPNEGSTSSANGNLYYYDASGNYHQMAYWDSSGFNIVSGSLVATEPGTGTVATPAVAETWHAMSLINTWANVGGGVVEAQYRYLGSPPKEVEVIGEISGGAIGNGTNINSALPSGYQPASTQTISIRLILGAGAAPILLYARVSTTGQIALEGIPAGTTRIAFHDTFSLDA
jgi:hypothetical protein